MHEIKVVLLEQASVASVTLELDERLEFGFELIIETQIKHFDSFGEAGDVEVELLFDLGEAVFAFDLER